MFFTHLLSDETMNVDVGDQLVSFLIEVERLSCIITKRVSVRAPGENVADVKVGMSGK